MNIYIAKTVGFLSKNSPKILAGVAVLGVPLTAYLAIDGTLKADRVLQKRHFEEVDNLGRDPEDPFTKKEIIKICWKFYIPMLAAGLGTMAAIVGVDNIHTKRNAALATLWTASEALLGQYREKVVEILGKSKDEKVHDAIVQDNLDKANVGAKEIVVTGRGDALFFDSWSGRTFTSEIEKVRKAQNDLNMKMLSGDMYCSLNDLYYELGLSPIEGGNRIGWTTDGGLIDITFTTKLVDSRPCVVVEYRLRPKEL